MDLFAGYARGAARVQVSGRTAWGRAAGAATACPLEAPQRHQRGQWKRGNYDTVQLNTLSSGNDARAAKVIPELGELRDLDDPDFYS